MKNIIVLVLMSFSACVGATIVIDGIVTDRDGNPVSKCDVFINSQKWTADFDTSEVYSLSTWASIGGSSSDFASFRPMSLAQPEFRNETADGKNMAILDVTPTVDASSIRGSIDEVELEFLQMNWA